MVKSYTLSKYSAMLTQYVPVFNLNCPEINPKIDPGDLLYVQQLK